MPLPPGPWLDHVSLRVPDQTEAADILWERFGLRVTPTRGAEERHGRIYLDRAYVEVVGDEGGAEPADTPPLSLVRWFLGHPDVPEAMASLRAAGLARRPATLYRAIDGEWWDGTPEAPAGTPSPLVVQRLTPAEVAGAWPPPLPAVHPSALARLVGVLIVTPYVAQTVAFYARLIAALAPVPPSPPALVRAPGHGAPADQWWEIALPSRQRIVVFDPLRPGLARDLLLQNGPSIAGVELAGDDIARTLAFLADRGIGYDAAEDERGTRFWLDPAATPGIVLGVSSLMH